MKLKSKQRIARCFLDDDGKEYSVAYFDGYSFGDRLLEGVIFKAELLPDGFLEVSTAPKSVSYMEDLNEKKWIEAALKYAIQNDIFMAHEGGSDENLYFAED